MRLIDADRLCEDLLDRWSIADTRKEELIIRVMVDIVTPIIASQPNIEPQPRKKGKWELRTDERFDIDYYKCSECGYEPYRKMDISNFCPNCGADMREGDSE